MSEEIKQCDCCGAMVRTLYRCFVTGIETYACAKCRGIEDDENEEKPAVGSGG